MVTSGFYGYHGYQWLSVVFYGYHFYLHRMVQRRNMYISKCYAEGLVVIYPTIY